jgi:hypothetical protein
LPNGGSRTEGARARGSNPPVRCLAILACIASWGLLAPAPTARAAPTTEAEPQPSVPSALRTGRGTTRGVALLFDNALLGEIMLRIEAGGAALVPKAALIDMLLPVFDGDKAVMSRLELMPETKGYVTLAVLQAAGFSIGFDDKQLRLARPRSAPPAQAKASAPPSSTPAKRVSQLDMGLSSGGKPLGDISVQVHGANTVVVPKAALIDMLTSVFDNDKAAMARLEAMAESDGHVGLAELRA